MEIMELVKYGINPLEIEKYIDRVKSPNVSVAITGEFSSGKSTFVNALVDKKDFLSHKNDECTPVFVELVKSNSNKFEVTYSDKSVKEVEMNDKNISEYTTYKDGYDEDILGITLPIDSKYIKDNVTIMDTPGTNTVIKKHEEITEYVLKSVDIVIYVLNKVIGQSDIEKIKELHKYTNNVIVVVTHMDEEVNGKWINRDNEFVEKLVCTVREELVKANSNFINIEVFPIGSLASYDDDIYISDIREVINDYVDFNNMNVIKNRVKSQLSLFFENTIKDIKLQVGTYEVLKSKDIEDIDLKMKKLNKLIEKNSIKRENQLKEIDIDIDNKDIQAIENNISRIFENEKALTIKKIVSNEDLSEEEISTIISESLKNIFISARNIIEKYINNKIDTLFDESNEDLRLMFKDIDIPLDNDIFIEKPSIDLIDNDYISDEIYKLKMKKNTVESEILLINDDIDRLKQESEIHEGLINECNDNIKDLRKDRIRHGNYIASYEEVTQHGGKDSGAKIGRFIGEVADILLLFATPQAGALKAADAVKDGSKIATMVGKAVKGAGKVHQGTKIIKEKTNGMPVLDKLKYLEVGFYGEKIGEKIGDMVKPTKTILVENEEERRAHEIKSQEIQSNLSLESEKLYELKKEKDNCLISMGEYRRRKTEMETNIKNYKLEEEFLLNKMEKEKSLTKSNLIREYYEENISKIFDEKVKECTNIGINIILDSNVKIVEKTSSAVENKLYELRSTLESLNYDRNEIETEIYEEKNKLVELENYKNWINNWVE